MNAEIARQSPREEYLAAHPKERAVQNAAVKNFNKYHAQMEACVALIKEGEIEAINIARRAGNELLTIEEILPGNQITFDFHEQLAGNGELQIHADMDTIAKYKFVAKSLDKDIETIEEAMDFRQTFMFFFGIKSERQPQNRIPPKDEWNKLASWLDELDVAEEVKKLHENPNYFIDGKLRPEVREWVDADWRPKFDALDLLRKELGI